MKILAMFFLICYFSITSCFPILLVHYLVHKINPECSDYFFCKKIICIYFFVLLFNQLQYIFKLSDDLGFHDFEKLCQHIEAEQGSECLCW